MSDEVKESAKEKGRTVWDVVWDGLTLALFNKTIWALVGVAISLCLILAYFDFVNIQYDNGLKLRVGVDPNIKKIEDERRFIEEHERIDEAKGQARFKSKFQMVDGKWSTSVAGDAKTLLVEGDTKTQGKCDSSEFRAQYQIWFGDYDMQQGVGRSTLSVTRSIRNGTWGGPGECMTALGYEHFSIIGKDIAMLPELTFDGKFAFIPKEADQGIPGDVISATYFEQACSNGCFEPRVIIQPISKDTLIYRGPVIFVSDKMNEANVPMERTAQ